MMSLVQPMYGFTHFAVVKNLEGVSHRQSLLHPASGGNCANWILGHILRSRGEVGLILGVKDQLTKKEIEVYGRGASGQNLKDFSSLEDLLDRYNRNQQEFYAAMEEWSDAQWKELQSAGPFQETPAVNLLTAFSGHEAYHAGQLGSLRHVMGLESAIR